MTRAFGLGAVIASALASACASSSGAPDAVAPPPAARASASATADAAHIADAYLALTQASVVPAPPRALAARAWSVLGLAPPVPPGDDANANAAALRADVRIPAGATWRVVEELALAQHNGQVAVMTVARAQALGAGIAGGPWTAPGFLGHRDARGAFVVREVLPGTPAEAAGIAPGDVLESVAGRAPWIFSAFQPTGLADGAVIPLRVRRASGAQDVSLTLAAHAPQVAAIARAPGDVGVVRLALITRAKDPTRDARALVAAAVQDFVHKGATRIVLDLRGNIGGDTPAAIASLFTAGDPIVRVRAPSGALEPMPRVGAPLTGVQKLAILVDDQTGSSAEMIALSLQEHGAARVFGQPTAGALTFSGPVDLGEGRMLLVPRAFVLGPKSETPPAGQRVTPDELVAPATADDVRAHKDATLDAALAWLARP